MVSGGALTGQARVRSDQIRPAHRSGLMTSAAAGRCSSKQRALTGLGVCSAGAVRSLAGSGRLTFPPAAVCVRMGTGGGAVIHSHGIILSAVRPLSVSVNLEILNSRCAAVLVQSLKSKCAFVPRKSLTALPRRCCVHVIDLTAGHHRCHQARGHPAAGGEPAAGKVPHHQLRHRPNAGVHRRR